MKVKGIDHVGIAMPALEGAAAFLGLLGLGVDDPVEVPGRGVEVQFVDTGRGKLELLAPVGADSPMQTFLDKRGPGLHHICLEVDDIHEAFEELIAAGVRMADEAPWMSPHGWAAYVHPRHWAGVAIELRQFVPAEESTEDER